MGTDGEIFERSRTEPELFEEIFARHGPTIFRYLRRRLGRGPAEELVSETFLIAFERRTRFDASYGSARPWLFGIAANLLRHHLREEQEHLRAMAKVPISRPAEGVEDVDRLDAQRLRPVLLDALLELKDVDREAFLLVAVGELSYAEVAYALRIPIGTVRSRIHRARRLLREQVPGLPAIEGQGFTEGETAWTEPS